MRAAALLLCCLPLLRPAPAQPPPPWQGSWPSTREGIHRFLNMDYYIPTSEINSSRARLYDYVWGVGVPLRLAAGHPTITPEPGHLDAWIASSPGTVRSAYIPYERQPFGLNASWLKAFAPDWLLYTCDRKTPANGERGPCSAGSLLSPPVLRTALGQNTTFAPLDMTNPDVVKWQVEVAAAPALQAGYNSIALDNFGLCKQCSFQLHAESV